ncbi:MAG: LPS export ABC transporter ATP-binding protein [bacterium]|nr:LPS export ABC transporter ATP-binding protein [bacterium]MDD5755736.1 LPS export ABC transporter ATP-binding protein [bacterium]
MSKLYTQELVKYYAKRPVVNKVSVNVNEGEIVGLLGPNGAGKTTTFYMTVGLLSPNSGQIKLDEHDITNLPMYMRARMGIGYLSQEPSIFRHLTVEENLLAILETLPLSKKERLEKMRSLLEEFDISDLAKAKTYLLSGGEKRRVEISRALVTNPKFILLDEPFLGIDPIAVIDIQLIISKLRNKGLGVLITDHNVRETLKIIDRAYIMYEGKILLQGSAKELVNNEKARQIYLGEEFTL